jgi:putative transcriptional regulator
MGGPVDSSLREKIAGDITLSENPGRTIRKWREELQISQKELAGHLRISPSMVSDYESGRRMSPGTRTIRRIVDAMLEIDRLSGRGFARRFGIDISEAIPSMAEFPEPIEALPFLQLLQARVLAQGSGARRDIHGYTVIDSMKAIATLNASDYLKVYGWSTQRALLFTGVKYGRSPMVAVRTHPLKPAMVVYVRPENVDELAVKLAQLEGVVLARTDLSPLEVVQRLEGLAASKRGG